MRKRAERRIVMYNASDLRKGLKIEIDGAPYEITDFNFVKPGKGQALYNCKLKNMINGATMSKTYRASDKMDQPALESKYLQYSYVEGDNFVFMDRNYEQILIGKDAVGESARFLAEEDTVEILFHNDKPIEVTLPNFVKKKIIYSEPGVRGDTANNVLKAAKIAGGYEIQVPLFVNEGDVIRIDTRTGKYVERVN
jgi:elongation factor P